jgi:2-polyprenyl-6-methoxyphenol hydroxylase-like FAD-dependent oxidoreductase
LRAIRPPRHAVERFATQRALGSGFVPQPIGLAVLDAIDADARTLRAEVSQMCGLAGNHKILDVACKTDAPGLAIHRASLFSVLWHAATAAGIRLETGAICHDALASNGKRLILQDNANKLGPFDLVIDASGAGSPLSPMQARPLSFGAVWGTVLQPVAAMNWPQTTGQQPAAR